MFIIGKCCHGEVLAAAVEDKVTRGFLEDMAATYTLERVAKFEFGDCEICTNRYKNNIKLLDTK